MYIQHFETGTQLQNKTSKVCSMNGEDKNSSFHLESLQLIFENWDIIDPVRFLCSSKARWSITLDDTRVRYWSDGLNKRNGNIFRYGKRTWKKWWSAKQEFLFEKTRRVLERLLLYLYHATVKTFQAGHDKVVQLCQVSMSFKHRT